MSCNRELWSPGKYGKPCIAGIEKVTERLLDEQLVEINGYTGVLRTPSELEIM